MNWPGETAALRPGRGNAKRAARPTAPRWVAGEHPPERSHAGRAYLKAEPQYLTQAAGRQVAQTPVIIPPAAKPVRARVAATSRRPRLPRVVLTGVITGTVLGAVIGLHVLLLPGGDSLQLGWYGSAVSALIGAKLLLSLLARPARDTPRARELLARAHVSAVITLYNEDPGAFRGCLESLLAQTRIPGSVTVVDDASDSPECGRIALAFARDFAARGSRLELITFPENRGKREGLAAAFRAQPDAFAYLCVDCDTILAEDAAERLLRPMASRRVQAVTGCVLAANRARNLLTRLIDLRYAYAFLGERAAYSVLGSVLCVCGSLVLYRGVTARKYTGQLTGQRFLGKACTYGDDRHMTFWCLKEGLVVLAPDAVAWTLVPYRMGHFLRQQLRWSKSFFRESVWMLARMSPSRTCWWLTLIEVGTWLGFTAALLYSLAVRPMLSGHFAAYAYLVSALLLSYARAGHYAEADHPGMGWRARLGTLLLAPLYGVIHMSLLLPLRVIALFTLADARWGTRKRVEVRA
jgi:hyaluronan synthase